MLSFCVCVYSLFSFTQSQTLQLFALVPNMSHVLLILCHGLCVGSVVQRPEAVGGCVPVTDEERVDILYKPQQDEWGGRSREEECARIVAGIDQLITVGMSAENGSQFVTAVMVFISLSRPVWKQCLM